MSATVESLLNTFERLPESDKQELAREILRRTRDFDVPALTDDELILSAEDIFLELDKESRTQNERTATRRSLVDLGFAAKVRPCLVISSIGANDEDRALATLVAHTTSPRASRFEVAIKTNFLKAGVFDAQNLVTVPHAKLSRRLGALSSLQMGEVEAVVRLWLGFDTV